MKKYLLIILLLTFALIVNLLFGFFQTDTNRLRQDNTASLNGPLNYSEQSHNVPGDLGIAGQWALSTLKASQAWAITTGSPEIYIAVLDTGIDEGHQDLIGQVIDRANFTTSPTTNDVYGHGTHIAGIIAAANNKSGITGMAYNSRLLNVKVADDGGWCDASSIAKGIRWSVDRGAKVINISLYTFSPSLDLEEAVNYAWSKGVVIVTPAGNGVGNKIAYPAYYSNSIAVAATNPNNTIPSWSASGGWVHIAAPGTDILSTMPHNKYALKSGTSMATAYVSGLAGLLFGLVKDANGNGLVNDEIRLAMENSCDPTNVSDIGRINALEALYFVQK